MRRTIWFVARRYPRRNAKAIVAACAVLVALTYAGWSQATQRERLNASARFDDARGASRYLLFSLDVQLADRPHTLLPHRQAKPNLEAALTLARGLDGVGARTVAAEVELNSPTVLTWSTRTMRRHCAISPPQRHGS